MLAPFTAVWAVLERDCRDLCVAFCDVFLGSVRVSAMFFRVNQYIGLLCRCPRIGGLDSPPPSDPRARLLPPSARSIAGAPRVNTVKYNRFHDQLLVSGSSDCMVHLWRVSSVSSAPLLEPEDEDAGELDGADGRDFGGSSGGSKGEAADIRVS